LILRRWLLTLQENTCIHAFFHKTGAIYVHCILRSQKVLFCVVKSPSFSKDLKCAVSWSFGIILFFL
jgi:hypothetical protein